FADCIMVSGSYPHCTRPVQRLLCVHLHNCPTELRIDSSISFAGENSRLFSLLLVFVFRILKNFLGLPIVWRIVIFQELFFSANKVLSSKRSTSLSMNSHKYYVLYSWLRDVLVYRLC